MKLALPLALAFLAGCGEGKQFVTRDEAADIADDSVDASGLEGRIADLEGRVQELENETGRVRESVELTRDIAASTADQVSHNARVANENALKEMTRRGACGYRTVRPEPTPGAVTPVIISQPIPCTMDDLAK